MKSNAWYVLFPGNAYALGPVRFDKAISKAAMREWAKNWYGNKLPRGTQIWSAE